MSSEEEVVDVVQLVTSLSRASGVLSREEERAMAKCAEVSKDVLAEGMVDLVRMAAGSPLLMSKSSDGTPVSVAARAKAMLPSGSAVSRAGRDTPEFLVMNQMGRCVLDDGGAVTRVLVKDPIPLKHGKSVLAQFEVQRRQWKSARELGHRGCAIEHFVFDRFGISAMERTWRQWLEATSPEHDYLSPGLPIEVFRLTQFVVVTGCACHDAQNAFRWGLMGEFQDRALMRDVYVCVESLRNSVTALYEFLAEWVATRLAFKDDMDAAGIDRRRSLWAALSVDDEVADLFAEEFQIAFSDGHLRVARKCHANPNLVGDVVASLMSAWRFIRNTDSRWLSLGPSSRGLMVGLLTGLDDFVAFVKEQPGVSLYYINGFDRFTGDARRFVAQAAICSRVADAVLCVLLEDPRVVAKREELWSVASEELLWVCSLAEDVWCTLADAAGVPLNDLRSSTVGASHTSYHFIWRRILKPSGELPWSLASGDVLDNLDALRVGERPLEPMAEQMWLLLQCGFDVEQLASTVRLLLEVSWTTTMAEQQHSSLALLMRYHPDYSEKTLVARAQVLMVRKLLPQMSQDEHALHRLVEREARLARKRPQAIGGRQVFFGALSKAAQRRELRGQARPTDKQIMRRHSALWEEKSAAERLEWERKARAMKHANRAAQDEEIEALQSRKAELRSRIAESAHGRKPMYMSAASLTPQQLEKFRTLLADPSLSRAVVDQRREAALTPPGLPTQVTRG